MCPAGPYAKRSLIGAPADVIDDRKCDGCSCTLLPTSCSNVKLTGYDDDACSKHPVTVDLDGMCHFVSSGVNFKNNTHFIYAAMSNPSTCSLSGNPPTAIGSFKVNNPTTLCCQ